MKYTKDELKELAREADYVEVYRYTNENHTIHTDNVEYCGNGCFDANEIDNIIYDSNNMVEADAVIMNDAEYSQTILANDAMSWQEMYKENDKVLVIVIK